MKQRSDLTFSGNRECSRHRWLRLTPAYSRKLVREELANCSIGSRIIDPFSGTGTTPLCAAEEGFEAVSLDINPFLVWLGNAKLSAYSEQDLQDAKQLSSAVRSHFESRFKVPGLWTPNLYKIEKWWGESQLRALASIYSMLREEGNDNAKNLALLAFSKTLIECSNASFSHTSMSFKDNVEAEGDANIVSSAVPSNFLDHFHEVIDDAGDPLQGSGEVFLCDSRNELYDKGRFTHLITSPPYVNRMSYIRELRPYMYWFGFLSDGAAAGELDWKAIGGTWGSATSKLLSWESQGQIPPIQNELDRITLEISACDNKNAETMATYVRKYFSDMWEHFLSTLSYMEQNGSVCYVIGNSLFYGIEVPAHEWYACMLSEIGYKDVTIEAIRKRNSKKELFEYKVTGRL